MAEVLAVVGTIVGLIELTDKLLQLCCNYVGTVRGAPGDIRDIKNQVSVFRTELQALRCFLADQPAGDDSIQHLARKDGALDVSSGIIKELMYLLGTKASQDESQSSPRTLRSSFARLSLQDLNWPRKERKARLLLTTLESHKNTITLALSTGLARDMQVVKAGVQQINASLTNRERVHILNWLCSPTCGIPSMHADKKELQEPDTCLWMTRNNAWKQCLSGMRKFIWIHGIPGAGKTVLASYLVESAAHACRSLGATYYYCHHGRGQDETAPMLKWVVRHLSKQAGGLVCPKLHACYNSEGNVPSVRDLLECLEEISHSFNHVYLIVDAVDESRPRDRLLSTLIEIGTAERFWKVSLLFTSRQENDIMTAMHDTRVKNLCEEISMSNNLGVREDIKAYVAAQLRRSPLWNRFSDDFITEVRDKLVQEARGMFRWAQCQVDVLKRLRDQESIRDAVNTLPKDIFATYERILSDIPERDQEFARTALALICSDTAEIPTAEVLVAACLYNVPYGDIHAYTVESLHEICGCLITLPKLRNTPTSHFVRDNEEDFHRVALAHYTVKEYLFFPDTAKGPAKFFALTEAIVRNIDLTVIFDGLRHFGLGRRDTGRSKVSRYEEHCLAMTEAALMSRRTDILRNEDLRAVVLSSLAPGFSHLAYLRQQNGITKIMKDCFPLWNKLLSWDFWPAVKETGILANLVLLDWYDMAEKYTGSPSFKEKGRGEMAKVWTQDFKFKQAEAETLLAFAVRRRAQKFLHLFVRCGATFEAEAEILYIAMRMFYEGDINGSKTLGVLKLLLGACANPNPKPRGPNGRPLPPSPTKNRDKSGFAFTPLQIAVQNLEQDWVETLLDEGADANATGLVKGLLPSGYDEEYLDHDEIKMIVALGQKTPLEICEITIPSWGAADARRELVKNARRGIETLLKRYGAKDAEEEAEEEEEEEEEGEVDDAGADRMVVDLTGDDVTEGRGKGESRATLMAAQVSSPRMPSPKGSRRWARG